MHSCTSHWHSRAACFWPFLTVYYLHLEHNINQIYIFFLSLSLCNVILVETSAQLKWSFSSNFSIQVPSVAHCFWFSFHQLFSAIKTSQTSFFKLNFYLLGNLSSGGVAQQQASLLSWTYYMCVYKCKPFRETWHRIDKQQTIGALTSLSKVCIIKSKRTLKPHTQGCSGLRIQDWLKEVLLPGKAGARLLVQIYCNWAQHQITVVCYAPRKSTRRF